MTGFRNGTLRKQRVIELAKRYLGIPSWDEAEIKARVARIDPQIAALNADIFRLVVMGEIKKGKSSFINALLARHDLLPVETDVATSTVYKIIYGPVEKYIVFFLPTDDDSGSTPEPVEITRDRLHEFGTERGNPDNEKCVAFIGIELPDPLLKEGVAIVDTPGVGGLFKKHRDITFQYAPNADVVFFVLDSVEAVISEDEVRFLKELKKKTNRLVFLQTKVDLAVDEQVQAWKKRNLSILEKTLEVNASQIPYFLVSAKLKGRADHDRSAEDLNDSGYAAVVHFLKTSVIPKRDEILAGRYANSLTADVLGIAQSVSDRLAIAQEMNKEKLAEYEASLLKAAEAFESWEGEQWPRRQRTFHDEISRLKRDVKYELSDALSPAKPEFRALLEDTQNRCTLPEHVYAAADEVLSAHAAQCNEDANRILTGLKNSYVTAYQRALGASAKDLQAIPMPALSIDKGEAPKDRPDRKVEAWQQTLMTTGAFTTAASAASATVGLTAGLAAIFLPATMAVTFWFVSLPASLTYLGVKIWSFVKGRKMARERQLAAALSSLENAMRDTCTTASKAALRAYEDGCLELDRNARDGFDAFRAAAKGQFTQRTRELAATAKRSDAEMKEAVSSLKSQLRAYADVLKGLQEITGNPASEAA